MESSNFLDKYAPYKINIVSRECSNIVHDYGIICSSEREIKEYVGFLCANFNEKMVFFRDYTADSYVSRLWNGRRMKGRNATVVLAKISSDERGFMSNNGRIYMPIDIQGGYDIERIGGIGLTPPAWLLEGNCMLYREFRDKYILPNKSQDESKQEIL